MTEASLDHLSERTKAGKEARARAGYHSGPVPFGYLPPDYPKAPTGAPSTWRPPPVPVRPDPLTFPALVRIGELVAQGWTDADIVEELRESLSHPSRFGAPRFTKETIAAIRRSWFPREFAPGCGHGTIKTPSGELVEGNHQAAWPYKLWQQMEAVKTHHYHRLRQQGQRQPHEFSRIIVCAACRRPLRVTTLGRAGAVYYQDTSLVHKRVCAAGGHLSVKSSTVIKQFEEMLSSVTLPPLWRQIIAQQCSVEGEKDDVTERVLTRRAALEAEQKRIISAFIKGDITEEDLDTQMERIRSELYELPVPALPDAEEVQRATILAGETLSEMAAYWNEATAQERRDLVWALLRLEGLLYDLERGTIVGLVPRPAVLPVLALGLEGTGCWQQCEGILWARRQYLPAKQVREQSHLPPPQKPSLTALEQERALTRVQQGESIRRVAQDLGTFYETIRRLLKRRGIVLEPKQAALTAGQQEEALGLVREGESVQQVARKLGISSQALRRLVKSKGVIASNQQPRLTPEQQQEALGLVRQGVSLREVGKQFGVSHQTIRRIVKSVEERAERDRAPDT